MAIFIGDALNGYKEKFALTDEQLAGIRCVSILILFASFAGMTATTEWNGRKKLTGGYIDVDR